jgi:hypothetical protein
MVFESGSTGIGFALIVGLLVAFEKIGEIAQKENAYNKRAVKNGWDKN